MFKDTDFNVFDDPTLDGRMDKIRTIIDPTFEEFAAAALPMLLADGQEWYAHVAKHIMRKTNPVDNTWVAFAPNKRGYKMMPHFEMGMWADHIYLYIAVEENMKPKQTAEIVPKLQAVAPLVAELPSAFSISQQHMINANVPLEEYAATLARFEKVKSAEVLVGVRIDRGDDRFGTEKLQEDLLSALQALLPIYEGLK
ncbi:DUF1054 family protein [Weissella tructae]|uniref:Uncharacterized protein n=2 Tax=Weissella TaxID=46255 RepID=A0A075TXG7_9LACO|nr:MULTISPECIES: DUF1054 family protein [Weissella]AIG64986.1 hypothetical protein WS08_0047 [Weissella tructae]AIM62298.1 hypothetical protein WS74_0046 [Weissella ceti]AIM63637.1 hypothetical protein WS105_0047 [Weissella ceti]ELA07822.1 hypothetical protein WCNC_01042 [Weissella ceti NC36]QVV91398.1 DUF1054 family protein [Weissella tructae]